MNKKEYIYPVWLRMWHWINALLFLCLILTGINLQYAILDNAFAISITIHNVCGVLLTLNYLFFFIASLISGNIKQYIPPKKDFIKNMVIQAKYYLHGIFKNEPHPFATTKENKFNPLQQVAYLKVMFVLFPVLLLTGWGLLFPEEILEIIFNGNGLFITAILHSAIGFFLSIFMIAHIYLGTTGHTVKSHFQSMMNGWHEIHD